MTRFEVAPNHLGNEMEDAAFAVSKTGGGVFSYRALDFQVEKTGINGQDVRRTSEA